MTDVSRNTGGDWSGDGAAGNGYFILSPFLIGQISYFTFRMEKGIVII